MRLPAIRLLLVQLTGFVLLAGTHCGSHRAKANLGPPPEYEQPEAEALATAAPPARTAAGGISRSAAISGASAGGGADHGEPLDTASRVPPPIKGGERDGGSGIPGSERDSGSGAATRAARR